MNNDDRIIVRVECAIPEFNECWVEYDASGWGPYEFRAIPATQIWNMQETWLETHSVDWHIPDRDGGTVKHPGQLAAKVDWMDAYSKMPADLQFAQWLNITPLSALTLALTPTKKRDARG